MTNYILDKIPYDVLALLGQWKDEIRAEGVAELKYLEAMDQDTLPFRGDEDHHFDNIEKWSHKLRSNGIKNGDDWHINWDRKEGSTDKNFYICPFIYNNRHLPPIERCPVVKKFLAELNKDRIIHVAGFSWVRPGATLYPHQDSGGPENGFITVNYCLIDTDKGSSFLRLLETDKQPFPVIIDGTAYNAAPSVITIPHKEGQYVAFDTCRTHMATNTSSEHRLLLVLGFQLKDTN